MNWNGFEVKLNFKPDGPLGPRYPMPHARSRRQCLRAKRLYWRRLTARTREIERERQGAVSQIHVGVDKATGLSHTVTMITYLSGKQTMTVELMHAVITIAPPICFSIS